MKNTLQKIVLMVACLLSMHGAVYGDDGYRFRFWNATNRQLWVTAHMAGVSNKTITVGADAHGAALYGGNFGIVPACLAATKQFIVYDPTMEPRGNRIAEQTASYATNCQDQDWIIYLNASQDGFLIEPFDGYGFDTSEVTRRFKRQVNARLPGTFEEVEK